jgi:chemotaxis protein MotB
MAANTQPIIVIKRKKGHGSHHGGAWKVAYADFVTAMMSLFIVLWLMGSSEKIKKAVAGYFNDPKGTGSLVGTILSGTGETVSAQAVQDMQKLKDKLEEQIKAKKELEKLSKQIEITLTSEGLRIELLEDKNGTFYQSGSASLSGSGQELLTLLAKELKTLPNSQLIEGHTDASRYSEDAMYNNWELSADRANAARRLMQGDGVRANQVTQVRGYADQLLRLKDNPYDPSNRRISILVKNQQGLPPTIKTFKADKDQTGAQQAPTNSAEHNENADEHGHAKAAPVGANSAGSQAKPQTRTSSWMARLRSVIPKFGK